VEPAAEAGKPAVLAVTAALEPGWHLYAVDQAPGGPLATRIELAANSGWRVTGPFVPDSPAKKQAMGQGSVWKELVIQEHSGRTTWRAPVVADKPGAASPSSPTSIRGSIRVQLCRDNSCTPPESYEFSAALPAATTPAAPPVTAAVPPAAAAKPARSGVDTAAIASRAAATKPAGGPAAERAAPPAGPPAVAADPAPVGTAGSAAAGQLLATHVPDKGHTAIEAAFAGNEAPWRLVVRLLPESGWHLYAPAASATTAVGQGKPTLLSATLPDGVRLESVRAVGVQPATQAELAAAGAVEGPVELEAVFAADGAVPAGAQAELRIGFQTCSDTSCDPPQAIRLGVTLPPQAGGPGIEFSDVRYAEAARGAVAIAAAAPVTRAETPAPGAGATTLAAVPPVGGPELSAAEPVVAAPVAAVALSLPKALFFGLLGGLILNLMPCVLPVLGLKLLSFAQQSGRARREVFQMNLWYCAGVFAVFFGLATASVAANLGLGSANLAWGEQFTSTTFNVVMIGIVFAFALAFLGIWELPIPGFIGEKAGHVQSREGPVGAFLKGVLSTVLATPCSGPFLGPVFGFTLTQSTGVTYAVFGAIATGMALPYIVVGLFPGLVRFLPKPGAWMNTFKELLGFVMLGTVAFFFSFLAKDWFVPTFVMMIGIWMACWWVGREQERKGVAPFARWLQAGALAAVVGTMAFAWLAPGGHTVIPWEKPFSQARLADLRQRGATVMVDFTADWCLTCKMNLASAIETRRVRDAVDRNRVVPVLADYTDGSDEIKQMLASLQSRSIPVLAIFPAARPGDPHPEPIVLRDRITEQQVLEALQAAGPSQVSGPEIRATASRPVAAGR
jgi:thiol:disulfide interchange protein